VNTGSFSQPTLWRTCRALANRTRLQICGLLFRQPGQTVSALAETLGLSLSLASQYLRALESRGLLEARREGRSVTYRPAPVATPAAGLVAALRLVFGKHDNPVETIFKTVTAFTHPRRIEIFGALTKGGQSLVKLRTVTYVPYLHCTVT